MVLVLHSRYRTQGGEERAVHDLTWLAREHLQLPTEVLERDSAALGRVRAATGILRGGLDPDEIARAVRRTGADIVHAHNLLPGLGPRALEAARAAGARVVLHLHNYRLVCSVGTCVNSRGEDCTRCKARDTRPGVRLNCRGSAPESVTYALALAAHQSRIVELADVVVVPSQAALTRLRELRAPLPDRVHVVPHIVRRFADAPRTGGAYAIVASRLAPEKAVDVAIDACRLVGLPLRIAGDGPERAALEARARGADVRFLGRIPTEELDRQRAGAAVVLAPTRAAETFGLAALEGMAAGLPTVATGLGAHVDLAAGAALVPRDDPAALADAAGAVVADAGAGARALATARAIAAPEAVAPRLAAVYAAAQRGERP
jgi:glycosyltransferase involved in cell wall biosynthesis